MSRKPTSGIDYTSRDYEAYRTLLIQKLQEKMPEYTDLSQTDAGIVILECLANGLDIQSLYADVVANDVLLPTTQDRRLAVILARQLKYIARNQTSSQVEQVFVLNEVLDRDTTIPKGTVVATRESSDQVTLYFETTDSLIIPAGCLGNEQNEDGSYKYSVIVEHGTTVKEDVLGTSNGSPYQTFQLGYTEVLSDSIQLMIDEGNGFEVWTKVSSFIDSDDTSKHFIATIDEFDNCFIEFGSGAKGKIPAIFDNGIIASYRVGGGSIGNVKANTITEISDTIAYVSETFNPSTPIRYGQDKESLEEIKENAPASFRTQDRAITGQDYADLLRINFRDSVLSAVGIPDEEVNLKMNVFYLMKEDYSMTTELLEEVTNFFHTRTIPGTTLELIEHEEYPINIRANLIVNNDYLRDEVVEYVTDYIKNTFFAYGSFKFKDQFTSTELEYEVKNTFSGIESFRVTSPTDDIITAPKESQIITLGTLNLNVIGGKEE